MEPRPFPRCVDPKPWRVIWAYHPVMNTWGSGSRTCPNSKNSKHLRTLVQRSSLKSPLGLMNMNHQFLFTPYIALLPTTLSSPSAINSPTSLSITELVPYFQDVKAHNRGPVPDVPPVILDRIRQGDARALQVMQGHAKAYNSFELVKYCTKAGVPPPPDKPQAPPAKSSPPITRCQLPCSTQSLGSTSPQKPSHRTSYSGCLHIWPPASSYTYRFQTPALPPQGSCCLLSPLG